jgi:ABC-type Fe3+-citrate transport system substrate-binding protein
MKKLMNLVVFVLVFGLVVGCSNQDSEKNEEAPKVTLEEISQKIKEQMAADMKEQGAGEDVLVDGQLQGYIEVDLMDDKDPSTPIYMEKMKLNKEEMEDGIVLAAMMNVNSDEIILLKAKDEAHVKSLKEALEREKESQIKTWEVYLPDQFEKVKNNVIKTNGNYLLYVTSANPEKIEEVFDSCFE